jgi:hypothetical protein
MASVLNDTIGGFNTYLAGLGEEQKVDYLFSLTLFNTAFENRCVAEPLKNVRELDTRNYIPDGWTALYDAIGSTVRALEAKEKAGKLPPVDKVMTVIMTDGYENSSREWTLAAIRQLIAQKEKEGNWTFVFLGATPDAWSVGMGMGVQAGNAVRYQPAQTQAVFRATAAATKAFAASPQSASSAFYADAGVESDAIEQQKDRAEGCSGKGTA